MNPQKLKCINNYQCMCKKCIDNRNIQNLLKKEEENMKIKKENIYFYNNEKTAK